MAFHLGSLGFLTPFKFDTYQSQVTQIIEGVSSNLFFFSVSLSGLIALLALHAHVLHKIFSTDVVFVFCTSCIFNKYLFLFTDEGNAAIVLRSRLRVRVLKENREKKARVDEKGIILTNRDVEGSRKAMQYQVSRIFYR